ncbi:hypothetical protein C0995_005158 [Termitomyces sp. Mi166|nr:hypothetical protein C0995_005158 [Termitomyces sp. Mi166\
MFLSRPKVSRALSAFDHVSRCWAGIPLRNPHSPINQEPSPSPTANAHAVGRQSLSLTTWNIQASQAKPVERSELILSHILEGPKRPDIIHLQEVAPSVRQHLLSDSRVRSSFLTTDAEDDTAFKEVPFVTMTLLSNKRFGPALLTEKGGGEGKGEGRYKRDALCVSIRHPVAPALLHFFNVHLDSLDSQFRRMLQMHVLNGLLREPGCNGGLIAGDFNAIHPDDYTLVDTYGLVDAWVALHGNTIESDGGATWGVGVELKDGLKPGRLDKVVMLGLQPTEIEVLKPGLIDADTRWSDHCGLHCTFTV